MERARLRRDPYDQDEITVVDRPMVKRAVTASSIGNCMERFDVGVHGYLATTMFLMAVATFAVGFVPTYSSIGLSSPRGFARRSASRPHGHWTLRLPHRAALT